MTGRALFDPGLQPERTELAWRRTCLAIGVGSALSLRVLPLALGSPWSALVGVAGLLCAGLLWWQARARHARRTSVLLGDSGRTLPGGRLLLVLTLFVSVCALAALVVIVSMRVAS